MSRLDYLTIGIVALCIAALIYLVYRYVNLPHPATTTTTTTTVDRNSIQLQKEDTIGFPAEDNSENAKPGPGAVVEPEVVPKEETPAQAKTEKQVVPEPKPAAPVTDNNTNETASLSAGRYMVLVSSFEQISQAQAQLQKVKKSGYGNARIAKFNRGKYASVLVDHFSQVSEANALAKTLKSKGFDARVMVKR